MENTFSLFFSCNNQKLRAGQITFDLPAGHACPFALLCFSKADKETGKLTDGPMQTFRCYSASNESVFLAARKRRWQNFDVLKRLKTRGAIFKEIVGDLPRGFLYRLHVSGDFFSQAYFDAWLKVAQTFPNRIFYAYTKALPFWIKRLSDIPFNFRLNASYGGTHDHLIGLHGLKSVTVVPSQEEANFLGLEIDHDDSHAWAQSKSFALLIHGNGPPGSKQAKLFYDENRKKMSFSL